MSKHLSRKWIGFLLVMGMGFILTILEHMDGSGFVALAAILVPAYFAADVAQDQLSRRVK